MSRPPHRGAGSAPASLYTDPPAPLPLPGRQSMPPDMRAPHHRPPELRSPHQRHPEMTRSPGGPPGVYPRPGSGGPLGRPGFEERSEAPQALQAPQSRRGAVNMRLYPRMVSRNYNGTG